jgi:cob(I)alamin adenosyltransferase
MESRKQQRKRLNEGYVHPFLLDCADVVTEMKEVKHYYRKGVTARVGIEK